MTAAIVLVLIAVDGNATSSTASRDHESNTLGLYHWGVGIELPMVGVMTGRGTSSRPGVGYSIGGAMLWEAVPALALRLYGRWSETRGGSADIAYTEAGERLSSTQAAEWFMAELGLGATYSFRATHRLWAPFVGADVGLSYPKGYQYRFDSEHEDLQERDFTTAFEEGALFGVDGGPVFDLRSGLQWQLTRWLIGTAELSAQYVGLSDASVSNTLNGPDVRATPESVLMVRTTFALLLLL